jgi:hypothetical protein
MTKNVYWSSLFLSDFEWKLIFLDRFANDTHFKFYKNPSSGSRVFPCGQTDGQKLMVAFRNFANARKNVSNKSCRKNENAHFVFNNVFLIVPFISQCGKNIVEPNRPRMTIWHMRTAY